jgi:hypothetical protein
MTDAINAKSDVLGERELDAVSGGDAISEQAKLNALENAQRAAEDKKAGDQIKAFQQLLTGI